jgi:hypothetical protein
LKIEDGIRVIDVQEFIRRFKKLIENNNAKFSLFLGAGCSVSSGIQTAGYLVEKVWLPRLKETETGNQKNVDEWVKTRFPKYKENDPAQSYGEIIETLFPTAKERQTEIENLVKDFDPGFGYAILAKLMEKYRAHCNIVLTTNFDDMVADALYLYTYQKPIVIFHEALAAFVKIGDTRPIVIKLHGDSKLSPLNTKDETDELSDEITQVIKNIFSETGLIFIGYGGNDCSVLRILNEVSKDNGSFQWGIYWIGGRIPNNKMGKFLREKNAIWVKHKDFDDLMLQVKEALELELPTIDRFDVLFKSLSSECDYLTKKIHEKPDSEEKEILEKAAGKASQELKISVEPISRPGNLSTVFETLAQGIQPITCVTPIGLTLAIEAIAGSISSKSAMEAIAGSISSKSAMEAIARSISSKSAMEAIAGSISPKLAMEAIAGSISSKSAMEAIARSISSKSAIEAIAGSMSSKSAMEAIAGSISSKSAIEALTGMSTKSDIKTTCLPVMPSTSIGLLEELETSKEEICPDIKKSKESEIIQGVKETKESSE